MLLCHKRFCHLASFPYCPMCCCWEEVEEITFVLFLKEILIIPQESLSTIPNPLSNPRRGPYTAIALDLPCIFLLAIPKKFQDSVPWGNFWCAKSLPSPFKENPKLLQGLNYIEVTQSIQKCNMEGTSWDRLLDTTLSDHPILPMSSSAVPVTSYAHHLWNTNISLKSGTLVCLNYFDM